MNDRLTELYRSCRPKEALASQEQFQSANVLMGSEVEKFAELIVRECATLNKTQSYELMGVIVDTEEGNEFDNVCLTTVKRVAGYLGANSLAKHFGVKE